MSKNRAIVIGAGPAGLGAALGLRNAGIDVLILEKQPEAGQIRRGETIRFNHEMESILGAGFFDKHTIHTVNKRRYYSHSGNNHVDRTISTYNIIINWPDFIATIVKTAINSGVVIRTGVEVKTFREANGHLEGVVIKDTVSGKEDFLDAQTIFSCGGIDDPGSRYLKHKRDLMDRSVYKILVESYSGPQDRLEYHFHIDKNGLLIGTIFPRGNSEAEIILMNFSGTKRPDLTQFAAMHPIFKERIEGIEPYYESATCIPMADMRSPLSAVPGLIMTGDAMGHVQGRGGSGIAASFLISYSAALRAVPYIKAGSWTHKDVRTFNAKICENQHLNNLRKHNFIYTRLRSLLMGRISSPQAMDRYWPLIKNALR